MNIVRKTKIVCTIGPASESPEMLKELMKSGMDVARLNFSHGDYEEHAVRIQRIRETANELGKVIAILLDTQGPEIRTTTFKGGEAELKRGNIAYITMKDIEGTAERFSVTYKGLIEDVHVGTKISLDDGLIELRVLEIDHDNQEVKTEVINSGVIKNKKGVNIPDIHVNLPAMTEKDKEDIKFGIEQNVDFIAASFIREQSDVLSIQKLLEDNDAAHIKIISKIENREGVDNINEILDASYGIMVARGDLGVEIPAEEVPLVQKKLIHQCNLDGKPVITATQMLDSMQSEPRPTRAEASDVANAIFDGTDAIMLSGETAAGDFPKEAVEMMNVIARKIETSIDHDKVLKNRVQSISMSITEAISQSVAFTAESLDVSALITPTQSGHSARMISKYRPRTPIVAVTFYEHVCRQLALSWGVKSVLSNQVNTTDELLDAAVQKGLETKLFTQGSKVVITAGVPVGVSGTTNLMKVHVIGDVIARGQGLGKTYAYGKAVVSDNPSQVNERLKEGDILVTSATDIDMMPAIHKAAGIVTESGGLTSHAAVVGLSLGIPVIVGVKDALQIIEDNSYITLEASTGNVHRGHASVL